LIVFCNGMQRSGSTWAYNVILELLRSCNSNQSILSVYDEHPGMLLGNLEPTWNHIVIKAHALDNAAHVLCRTGAARSVFTWRDPFDAIASLMRTFGHSFETSIESIRKSIGVWEFCKATGTSTVVSYRSIIETPTFAIRRIAADMGFDVSVQQVDQVADATSFERMKRASQTVEHLDSSRIIRDGVYTYDRETLLHQDHIRDGGSGYGKQMLSPQQLCAIDVMMDKSGFWSLVDSD
jgi:hypothetical protein